jgi:protein SCO1/2
MANVITGTRVGNAEGGQLTFALFFCCIVLLSVPNPVYASTTNPQEYEHASAFRISQAAIGKSLGNYSFKAADGSEVRLGDYLGTPLLISMIFTSCHHICPSTTRHLLRASEAAQEVFGNNTFNIVSVGFDTVNDTPDAMRAFARQQGIDADNWQFLSATPETIAALSEDLGFQFFTSPRGFDHLIQVSMIDRQGVVYSQVYDMNFKLPALVEPLKRLVLNRPASAGHPLAVLADRVRLFCTVYDPATGRYVIDNSLFFQIGSGFTIVFGIAFYLFRETRRARSVRRI